MNIVLCGKIEWTKEELQLISDCDSNELFFLQNEENPLPIPASDVDAVVCNWFFKYHTLRDFVNLKFIQLLSVGYNGIDVDAVNEMGITLCCAKDVYSIPISEFVIARILAFYKKESYFLEKQKNREWAKFRDIEELSDKNVLIVGTGSIGNEVAKRMAAFTDNVFGCNRTIRQNQLYKTIFPLEDIQSVISDFDIVIITIALTNATKHIINSKALAKMKRTSLLVNVSRGEVVDEKALIEVLRSGSIRGAILDVFSEEPLPENSPLWGMKDVYISPHNSFASVRNEKRLKTVIIRNIREWVSQHEQYK